VIDGGSLDGTIALLKQRENDLAVLISETDNGIYDALNKGIRNSSGEVIGFLHADDLFENDDVLAMIADEFSDPEVDAVYGDLVYVSQHDVGRVIRYWRAGDFIPDALRRGWMPPHPTLYVRQSVYERAGLFDSELKIAADYDSILRIFSLPGLNARCIHEVLIRMRAGGVSNRSLSNVIRKSREDLSIVRKNKIGGLGTVLLKNFSKLSQLWYRQHPTQSR